MSVAVPVLDAPPELPPGWDVRRLLAPLMTASARVRGRGGAAYRRHITKDSPFLFALLYFPNRLQDADTGIVSFSALHLALCHHARGWADRTPERAAVIGPRDSGKSVWCCEILPAWTVAHGHAHFPVVFSGTGAQARAQLANLRKILARNELLIADFPELAPLRVTGAANRSDQIDLVGGTIGAAGLAEETLGLRVDSIRPGPLLVDDAEPLTEHAPERKRKILSRLRFEVLPMNSRADVLLAGTTTMYRSLAHDLVRAGRPGEPPGWVGELGFSTLHFPALQLDARGGEASLWPRRWPLDELRKLRADDPEDFALNYQCDPQRPGGADGVTYWTPESIRYDPRARPTIYRVAVDVAVTRGARSDFTTICVVGYEPSRRRAVVVHIEHGKWTLLELQERLWALHAANPELTEGVIETNQGGELWLTNMVLPARLRLRGVHEGRAKDARIRTAHRHYARNAVVHLHPFPALEQQMCEWPSVEHDDLVDVLARALEETFAAVA